MHVRPVRPADGPAIRKFLEALSPESIGFRFFGQPNLQWATSWSVNVDYTDRFALLAEGGSPHRILAHAAYVRIDANRGEVAFMVADDWQGLGISTILLAHLAEVAQQHGISTFVAEVLPQNHRMIDVFRESGFPAEVRSVPDALEVELPTSLNAMTYGSGTRHGRSVGSHSSMTHVGKPISVKPKKSLDVPPKDLRRSQMRILGGALKLNAKTLA